MELDKLPIGYLTWWSIPENFKPKYSELETKATDTGFSSLYVPKAPSRRNAWLRATNLGGKRGRKVEVAEAKVDWAKSTYDVEPICWLRHKTTNTKPPVLRRHLIRDAVVPSNKDAKKQLYMRSVAIMQFDADQQQPSTLLLDPTGDEWVEKETIMDVVESMDNHMIDLGTLAEGRDIRHGIRRFLESLHRINLIPSSSVCFVPFSVDGVEDQLKAMRQYIRSMANGSANGPECYVMKVDSDDEITKQDIVAATISGLNDRIMALNEMVEPIFSAADSINKGRKDKKGARGLTAKRISENALIELMEIKEAIQKYRESLKVDFDKMGLLFTMAQNRIFEAGNLLEIVAPGSEEDETPF